MAHEEIRRTLIAIREASVGWEPSTEGLNLYAQLDQLIADLASEPEALPPEADAPSVLAVVEVKPLLFDSGDIQLTGKVGQVHFGQFKGWQNAGRCRTFDARLTITERKPDGDAH